MLKNIAVRCKKLEDTATKLSEHKEKDKKDVIGQKERVKNNVIEINDGSGRQNRSGKHRVTWIGTSLSKVLNRKKFEDDLNVELHTVKAYCINKEGRFPECNFEDMVPKVVSEDNTDTLVLQTGSIEITNIDVNNAMMDPSKNIEKYKEEWFEKVEEASNKLFKIAEDAIEKAPNMNVVIVKRLPRFDRASNDIIGIKSQLSTYANSIYDQLWLKKGSPGNIHIVEVDLKCSNSRYLKSLIFGDPNTNYFDGVHLKGPGASRHFTYRVNQVLKPVLQRHNANRRFSSPPPPIRTQKVRSQPIKSEQMSATSNHTNCEQAQYKRRQLLRHKPSYAQVVQDGYYSVTTSNRYEHLNY